MKELVAEVHTLDAVLAVEDRVAATVDSPVGGKAAEILYIIFYCNPRLGPRFGHSSQEFS
jgi:hypothetical protein